MDDNNKKLLSEKVSRMSEGLSNSLSEFLLYQIAFWGEALRPQSFSSFNYRLGRKLDQIDREQIRRAYYNCQEKGWLNPKGEITKKGKERLSSSKPVYQKAGSWDRKWYLVIYDILEEERRLRKVLRERLKKLGFGKLQASVWISAFNFLKNVKDTIDYYDLETNVILAVTDEDKLSRESSQDIANRVWNLEELNNDYFNFVLKYTQKGVERFYAPFEYLAILKRDPQLPKELLPPDWYGEEAHQVYKKLQKQSIFH